MRRLIIYLLIIIFSFFTFGFLSIKNTNALEHSVYNDIYFDLNASDSNSGAIFYYIPENRDYTDIFTFKFNTGYMDTFYLSINNYQQLSLYLNNWISTQNYALPNNLVLCYIVLGFEEVGVSQVSLACQYGYIYYNGTEHVDLHVNYTFDNVQLKQQIDLDYLNGGIRIFPYMQNSVAYNGLINGYIYDCLDYVGSYTEYFEDVKENYIHIPYNIKSSYDMAFNNGYQEGYDEGYQDGYNSGIASLNTAVDNAFTRGYNEGVEHGSDLGYQEGYSDGYIYGFQQGQLSQTTYQEGYDDGYQDGLRDTQAYAEGYDRGREQGYDIGYDVGYEDGINGDTAVSPVFKILLDTFAGIGEILLIELAPNITIGMLIFIPLFFAIIGFVLWIWRRN